MNGFLLTVILEIVLRLLWLWSHLLMIPRDWFRVDIGHCFTVYGVWKFGKHTAYMEFGRIQTS